MQSVINNVTVKELLAQDEVDEPALLMIYGSILVREARLDEKEFSGLGYASESTLRTFIKMDVEAVLQEAFENPMSSNLDKFDRLKELDDTEKNDLVDLLKEMRLFPQNTYRVKNAELVGGRLFDKDVNVDNYQILLDAFSTISFKYLCHKSRTELESQRRYFESQRGLLRQRGYDV